MLKFIKKYREKLEDIKKLKVELNKLRSLYNHERSRYMNSYAADYGQIVRDLNKTIELKDLQIEGYKVRIKNFHTYEEEIQ